MNGFRFATAGRIVFGSGVAGDAIEEAARWGGEALVITGRDRSRARHLVDRLTSRGVRCRWESIAGEPTVEAVSEIVDRHRGAPPGVVIAIGGGSVIDAAKAVSALAANPGDVTDYLEVVGRGRPLEAPGAPVVAVPTTAGTGAEATANAVLASPAHRVKVSLRTVHMLPRLAIVDPVLTVSMPPEVTAATGFDAIAQLIECLVSLRATALTDPLCREGLRRGAPALERAWARGDDLEARESMAFASLTGGIGLANAGLGAVHGFAGPIGGMFPAPHGMVCAALLPHVMAANVEALTAAGAVPPALERYREVAAILTGDPSAGPRDGAAWAAERCRSLGVPPLSAWGIAPGDIPSIVSKARRASSMKGNPVSLSSEALAAVLEAAL